MLVKYAWAAMLRFNEKELKLGTTKKYINNEEVYDS